MSQVFTLNGDQLGLALPVTIPVGDALILPGMKAVLSGISTPIKGWSLYLDMDGGAGGVANVLYYVQLQPEVGPAFTPPDQFANGPLNPGLYNRAWHRFNKDTDTIKGLAGGVLYSTEKQAWEPCRDLKILIANPFGPESVIIDELIFSLEVDR